MCWSKGERRGFRGASQCRRPRRVSRIEAQESLEQCSMGIRLMIIKLGNYNSAKELLIGTRTTGSQVHVCYRNGDQSAFVTRAAVRMEVEGRGMQIGHRGAYKWGASRG